VKSANWKLGGLIVALVAAAIVVSLLNSPPAKLPGAALGSNVVLYIERAAGVFAVLLLGAVVIFRAFQGDLPVELSGRGVKWTPREVTEQVKEDAAAGVDELRQGVVALRDITVESLRLQRTAIEAIDERLRALEGEE
jgi:hypothetical protein